jgi:uncharacterized protein DUF4389
VSVRDAGGGEGQAPETRGASRPYPVRLDGWIDPDLTRWRWLVKWFLAIPHLVILALLWVVALTLTVVAWFAILLTGSYPRAIFDFNAGVLRWTWRVQFFGFDVLATDRSPPFSLEPDPAYPADLTIDYPAALSRRLVLVKSWLLALPQLAIAVVIAGVPFWVVRDLPWSAVAGGLLGLLTLAAMVVLLFKGRYPEALFDLVMGLNRWVYRVLAYVLLMRDEYPPFRLDVGGVDPGTAPTTPPAWMRSATPIRRKTPADERRSGIRLTIIGALLVIAAFGMWWLVAVTNREGDRGDPQLLPIFAAIPLAIGLYHLLHAHSRAGRSSG